MATHHAKMPIPYGRGTIQICRCGSKASILIVAMDRPRFKNAFSDDLYSDLVDVMNEVASEESLAAMILTGIGSYFSSGADLKGTNFMAEDGSSRDTLHLPAGKFMMALLEFPKIICAAVNGPAVGIGVTLLFHCDLCYCSERATFWAPFTRLALVPELCSSATFLETMGLSKANELLLLGRKIDAKTAVDWNICSQISPGSTCDNPFHPASTAHHLARELDERLLGLPLGQKTGEIFVKFVRGQRKARLQRICREELTKLDERFNSGEVLEAFTQLPIFTKGHRSRL
jgi:peroxisomal 3,2-trans-enoyl-CoA isomerase